MNDLSHLFEQIRQLSDESQSKLADYITFLQWQENRGMESESKRWSFSFIEAFKKASVRASDDPVGMDAKMAPAIVGGESRPALWAHPPVVGQAVIEYFVPVPEAVEQVRLNLSFGIRDGAQISEDNLVAFSVKVDGMRVWGHQSNAQDWQEVTIPLTLTAGAVACFEFATEALGRHEWTWAVWGNPELTGL